jgi:hypothetical protein
VIFTRKSVGDLARKLTPNIPQQAAAIMRGTQAFNNLET